MVEVEEEATNGVSGDCESDEENRDEREAEGSQAPARTIQRERQPLMGAGDVADASTRDELAFDAGEQAAVGVEKRGARISAS